MRRIVAYPIDGSAWGRRRVARPQHGGHLNRAPPPGVVNASQLGTKPRTSGTHATRKCAFEHTTAGRPMIEFVRPDLVDNEFTEGETHAAKRRFAANTAGRSGRFSRRPSGRPWR